MSKVIVDQEKCIGCGACVAISPENFDFNEDGISVAISNDINENTKNAEEACPVLAIDIIENENCECNKCICDENCSCNDDCCDCDDCCNCDDCNCCDDCTCDSNSKEECECNCDKCECHKEDE